MSHRFDTQTTLNLCDATRLETPSFVVNTECQAERDSSGQLDPVVKWQKRTFNEFPEYDKVMMTPVVLNLTDDNGDGKIDANDVADIAFIRYTGTAYNGRGILTVISGDDGRELFSTSPMIPNTQTSYIHGSAGVALGDLDGNGLPEMCTPLVGSHGVMCWEATGNASNPFQLKWHSTLCTGVTYPSIANVDGQGDAELIVGACILRADGSRLGRANPLVNAAVSYAVNLDADPELEIIAGPNVYDLPSTPGGNLVLKYRIPGIAEGATIDQTAVADFDGDGEAEIVVVDASTGRVILFDPNAATDADTKDGWVATLPGSLLPRGGSANIADFDGDGEVEVAVAGDTHYVVFDNDGSILWSQAVQDFSSRKTGSSVFDFDGDGRAEVLYADEKDFFVFDGPSGTIRARFSEHNSGTLLENPVVADIDGDGQAEILVASVAGNGATDWTGITALESASNSWMPVRPVWNQHAYSVTHINDDGSVPVRQAKNWMRWNNFRTAVQGEGLGNWMSDLFLISGFEVCDSGCTNNDMEVSVRVVVGNRGLLDATNSVIELRNGASVVATGILPYVASGESAVATVTLPAGAWGNLSLTAHVKAGPTTPECDITNNSSVVLGRVLPSRDIDEDGVPDSCDTCFPSAELCDGIDNDCDGETDEDYLVNNACTVGVGACQNTGTYLCTEDGLGVLCSATPGTPSAEVCDGIDNDCDGESDEGFDLGEACVNGLGECAREGVLVCNTSGGAECSAIPGTPSAEVCDGKDNNCDGEIDNTAPVAISCGVGACQANGWKVCVNGGLVDECQPGVPAANDALCDGIDNDCDGEVDEDYQPVPVDCGECKEAMTACAEGQVLNQDCVPLDDGLTCDAGLCSVQASCVAGECVSTRATNCDDGNPCTNDSCDETLGCQSDLVADGTSCSDDNGCTLEDSCQAGVCVGSERACEAVECMEGGVCNPATGVCDYQPIEGCAECLVDTTAPEVTCPQDQLAVECEGELTTVVLGSASGLDSCSEVSFSHDGAEGYALGETTVTFVGTDASQNSSTCTTTVTVVDTQAPSIVCPETIELVGDANVCGITHTLALEVQDSCDAAVTVTGHEERFYEPGRTNVRIVARDASGNEAICDTVVVVTGLDNPALDCTIPNDWADIRAEGDGGCASSELSSWWLSLLGLAAVRRRRTL